MTTLSNNIVDTARIQNGRDGVLLNKVHSLASTSSTSQITAPVAAEKVMM